MARKEETLADHLDQLGRRILGAAGRIGREVDRLQALEKYLERSPEVIAMFRLHCTAIKQELAHIGSTDAASHPTSKQSNQGESK